LKDSGGRREQAMIMLSEGKTRDEICKALKLAPKTLSKWRQEGIEFDSNSET
jgi:transposase-like protein